MELESSPPDKDTPTGTSLRIRNRTESSKSSRNAATGSDAIELAGPAGL
jgi:hypothetical protein